MTKDEAKKLTSQYMKSMMGFSDDGPIQVRFIYVSSTRKLLNLMDHNPGDDTPSTILRRVPR